MIGDDADVPTVPVSQGESSRPPTQSNLSVDISDAFNEIFGTGDFSSFPDFNKTFATFQVCTHSVYRVHKSARYLQKMISGRKRSRKSSNICTQRSFASTMDPSNLRQRESVKSKGELLHGC